MDRKLKLYLMTNKGLSALITLISNLGSTVIHSVVCAKDAGVVEDYYREIESVCKDNGIRFIDRLDAQIKEAGIYSIAIG